MEQHCIRLFVALTTYLGNIIEDGDVVNDYTHAEAEGTLIYIVVDDVFKAWFQDRFQTTIHLGSCVRVCKAMQGHPSAGSWWSDFFTRLVRRHSYRVQLSRNALSTAAMTPLHLVRLS
jgi:hypothetical protein